MLFYERKAEPIKLLPEMIGETDEMQVICEAAGEVIDSLNRCIAETADSCFIKTASGAGLQRWEKILDVSSPLDSTEQSRREALSAKLISKPPINAAVLKNIIETYMGVEADIETVQYLIKVSYRGESKVADLAPMFATVYELIPADMLLEISYRYLIWQELDSQQLSFEQLDEKEICWSEFEKGEWING